MGSYIDKLQVVCVRYVGSIVKVYMNLCREDAICPIEVKMFIMNICKYR